jgi:hypothetical protein
MIRRLPRSWGVIIRCDGGGCQETVQTANVLYRVNRRYAECLGWGRGSVRSRAGFVSTKKCDFCPACLEWDRAAARQQEEILAERRRRMAEARRAGRARLSSSFRDAPPGDASPGVPDVSGALDGIADRHRA